MAVQVNEGDGKSPIAEQISPVGLGRKFGLNVTDQAISPARVLPMSEQIQDHMKEQIPTTLKEEEARAPGAAPAAP